MIRNRYNRIPYPAQTQMEHSGGGNLAVILVRMCGPTFQNPPHSYTWALQLRTHSHTYRSKLPLIKYLYSAQNTVDNHVINTWLADSDRNRKLRLCPTDYRKVALNIQGKWLMYFCFLNSFCMWFASNEQSKRVWDNLADLIYEKRFQSAKDRAETYAEKARAEGRPGYSLRSALTKRGWVPKTFLEDATEYSEYDYSYAFWTRRDIGDTWFSGWSKGDNQLYLRS